MDNNKWTFPSKQPQNRFHFINFPYLREDSNSYSQSFCSPNFYNFLDKDNSGSEYRSYADVTSSRSWIASRSNKQDSHLSRRTIQTLLAENPTCNSPTMLVTTEERTKMRSTTVEVEMVISPQMSGISRFFSFIAGLLK